MAKSLTPNFDEEKSDMPKLTLHIRVDRSETKSMRDFFPIHLNKFVRNDLRGPNINDSVNYPALITGTISTALYKSVVFDYLLLKMLNGPEGNTSQIRVQYPIESIERQNVA